MIQFNCVFIYLPVNLTQRPIRKCVWVKKQKQSTHEQLYHYLNNNNNNTNNNINVNNNNNNLHVSLEISFEKSHLNFFIVLKSHFQYSGTFSFIHVKRICNPENISEVWFLISCFHLYCELPHTKPLITDNHNIMISKIEICWLFVLHWDMNSWRWVLVSRLRWPAIAHQWN